MFMHKKGLGAIAVIAASLSVSPLAQAANDFYVGVNLERMTDKGDLAPPIHPIGMAITGGIQLHPNFALEARVSTGVKSAEGTVNGITYDLKLDRLYGVFAKASLPLGRVSPYLLGVSPYLLAGYSYVRETAHVEAFNFTASDSARSFSYGIGVDVPITKTTSFHLEWAQFLRGIDDAGVRATIRGVSAGVSMHF